MKILILEDNEEYLGFLEKMALKAGHELIKTKNAKDFFERLKIENPDLLLIDILLPSVNGIHVFRGLEKHNSSKIPVVLVSSMELSDIEPYLKAIGAKNFICKGEGVSKVLKKCEAIANKSLIAKEGK